jgi:hypothetical protein
MGVVEDVKQPLEVLQPISGDYPIIKPDGEVYALYESPSDWIEAYADLASKVMQSTKLTDEQRTEKIAKLAEANMTVTEKFSSFDKIKIRAELAQQGVNQHPKSPASQFVADMEHSDKIF